MNDRTPPKIPAWLLARLGYLRHNPALLGDLLEEFHGGRSRAWYWRQAAMVIAVGIRANATRGLLRGFAILFAIQALLDWFLWRVRGDVRIGNFDYPGFFGCLVVGFFAVQLLRRKPIGGVDAGGAALLYVIAAPWMYAAFPNDMSLAGRICVDFLQLAFTFGVASIPARVNKAGPSR